MPVVIFLCVLLLVWLLFSYVKSVTPSLDLEGELELLQRCLGDRAQMERLISHEMRKSPKIVRREAVRRAIHAHRRDSR